MTNKKTNRGTLYQPSEKERHDVLMLSATGVPHENISKVLGISRPTLNKHFKDELELGKEKANLSVTKALFHQATNLNNVTAQIFWAKTRMKWSEPPREISGPEGKALNLFVETGIRRKEDDSENKEG